MPTLDPTDAPKLRALIQICDTFQEAAGPTVPLAVVEAFMLVALYEGASLKDLCRLSGQAQSTSVAISSTWPTVTAAVALA